LGNRLRWISLQKQLDPNELRVKVNVHVPRGEQGLIGNVPPEDVTLKGELATKRQKRCPKEFFRSPL